MRTQINFKKSEKLTENKIFGLALGLSLDSQKLAIGALKDVGFLANNETDQSKSYHLIFSKPKIDSNGLDLFLYLQVDSEGVLCDLRLLAGISQESVNALGFENAKIKLKNFVLGELGTPSIVTDKISNQESEEIFVGLWGKSEDSAKKLNDMDEFISFIQNQDPGPCVIARINSSQGGLVASIELTNIMEKEKESALSDPLRLRNLLLNLGP